MGKASPHGGLGRDGTPPGGKGQGAEDPVPRPTRGPTPPCTFPHVSGSSSVSENFLSTPVSPMRRSTLGEREVEHPKVSGSTSYPTIVRA